MELKINDLSFSYNSVKTLEKISLEIKEREILGIIGPNGSGKTTLLKCMNKKLEPETGAVLVNDLNILRMNSKEVAKNIGVVPQVSSVSFPFTVYDLVLMGRYSHQGRFDTENENDRAVVDQCLDRTGIAPLADRLITEISGGEYQKVIIARALAQQPKILLLDEVTLHLDINHQIEILDLIKALSEENNLAIVMVLHDLSLAARYSTKTIMLQKGRIFASGRPEEVISIENIRDIYGIEAELGRSSKGNFLNIIPVSIINKES
ncbi:MAG: ABC transporter ATP-binding protein [Elusimicrobiota bacterium]